MELLKKMSLKIKLAIGAIASVISFFLFFFIKSKMRTKDKMDYELSRTKSELEIVHLEEDSEEKLAKVAELENKESVIREKIKFLEEKEAEEGPDVSMEELDAFFDKRGL